MDNALYVNLTRQTALLKELNVIAVNMANMNTTGFRREATVFSEYIQAVDGPTGSLSMAAARVRYADPTQGALVRTGGQFDFAIEGDGYFQVATPNGSRLTRAGAFTPDAQNQLTTMDGFTVLGESGAPIFVPPDAKSISVAPDGSISADGRLIDRLGVFTVSDQGALRHDGGTLLVATAAVEPMETPKISQGFVETSNVQAISEISRLIEVQRAYELGQSLTQAEIERMDKVISTLGRAL